MIVAFLYGFDRVNITAAMLGVLQAVRRLCQVCARVGVEPMFSSLEYVHHL